MDKQSNGFFSFFLSAVIFAVSMFVLILMIGCGFGLSLFDGGFISYCQNVMSAIANYLKGDSSIFLFLKCFILSLCQAFPLALISMLINVRLRDNVVKRFFENAEREGSHEESLRFNVRDFFTLPERVLHLSSWVFLFASVAATFSAFSQVFNALDMIPGSSTADIDKAVLYAIAFGLGSIIDFWMVLFGFFMCRHQKEYYDRD